MSKFKSGQTSVEVLKTKNDITKSIERKLNLLKKINTFDDIYSSLDIKRGVISERAIFQWEDSSLEIRSFSRNTAYQNHNKRQLHDLLDEIKNSNLRLTNSIENRGNRKITTTSRLSEDAVKKLKNENEELRKALAEVYRAYMQTLEHFREDKQVDEALRRLIINQAAVLGIKRVVEVK